MTHLTPYEPAARILCGMQGQDPDQGVPSPHPLGLQLPHTRPAWHFAAEALIGLSQMLAALKQAAEQQQPEVH